MPDWPEIVRQHSPAVWKTAYRLLGNHADAADCLQETFASALNVSRRQPVRHWPGLLQRIATHRALDRLRQRLRRTDREHDLDDWSEVASANPGPEQAAVNAELVARLRRALTELPDQQAEVFSLKYLSDMSYQQIAAELEIEGNAVGVLLHRARTRLRELLVSADTRREA